MKIMFTCIGSAGEGYPPLGIAYLASYLRKHSHRPPEVIIVDKEKNVLKFILKNKPDLVGISSVSRYIGQAINFANQLKETLQIPIILGGSHMSSTPHLLPKVFNVGVIGEGERTLLELYKLFNKFGDLPENKLKNINGIAFFKNKKIMTTRRREPIEPIDLIPFPSRDLLKMKNYLAPRRTLSPKKLSRATGMFTSRGCPFRCIFCASSCIWYKVRFYSPEYVVGEMKELIEKYKVEGITMLDDLFPTNKKRLRKLVELIRKERINEKVKIRCSIRTDLLDVETCKLLKKINVSCLCFGFESGSDKILKYLNKGTTVKDNLRAVKLSKKFNFEIFGYFMIGSPTETKKDMFATLKFIKQNPIDSVGISITTPYPGTKLWEYAVENNIINEKNIDWGSLNLNPENLRKTIFLNGMSREEFLKIYNIFKKEIEEKRHKIEFKFKDLFSLNLLKRTILHPKKSWKFIHHSVIKRHR